MRQPRARGHAVLAAQARRALGVADMHALGDVPLPLVHAALGLAACAVAFLVRVPVMGLRFGVIDSGAVAAGTGAVLLLYDRLVYDRAETLRIDAVALPMAAVGAFAIVLAMATSLWVRLLAAVVAAAVIGGVPYLDEREAAGRTHSRLRLARDLAAIVVAAPFALGGVAGVQLAGNVGVNLLAPWSRTAVAGVGLVMVAVDGLRVEAAGARRVWLGALACGVVAAVIALAVNGGAPGVRAALILIAWYGARGVAVGVTGGRRSAALIAEYAVFTVFAFAALFWVAGR